MLQVSWQPEGCRGAACGWCSSPWGRQTTTAARSHLASPRGWGNSFGQCSLCFNLGAVPWVLLCWGRKGIMLESTFSLYFFPHMMNSYPTSGTLTCLRREHGKRSDQIQCLDSYNVCPNFMLQLLILYLCIYFPNSVDNATALLLLTSSPFAFSPEPTVCVQALITVITESWTPSGHLSQSS